MSKLRELLEKATPEPWKKGDTYAAIIGPRGETLYYDEGTATEGNDNLIIYLRNNAEAIAMLIEAAEKVLPTLFRETPEHHMHYIALRAAISAFTKGNEECTNSKKPC